MAGNFEQLLAEVLAVYLPSSGKAGSSTETPQASYSGLVEPPPVNPDEEEMIAAVMRTLRGVVAAAERNAVLSAPPPNAVYGVLSGSELMMRWECMAGRSDQVPGLLHGFAYLSTVYFLDRKEALCRSDAVLALVKAAGYEVR